MAEIFENKHCNENEIASLNALIANSDKVSKEIKTEISLSEDFNYSYFDAPKDHMYKTYKFRYDRMIENQKNNQVKKELAVLVKNIESKDYSFIRLTFIKTKKSLTYWLFSDTSYKEVLGVVAMPSIPD